MKKLLIVVDYQNDFVDGKLGFEGAKDIENNIVDLINMYHNNNDDVMFTFDTHFESYMESVEGKFLPVPHCIKGTNGHNLTDALLNVKKESDVSFEKFTFPSLDLANYIKEKQYDEVQLCGVVSNICVLSNAVMVKAALPNARIFICENSIASNDNELHQKGIDILKNLHIEII